MIGLIVLTQVPSIAQVIGIALVVAAGAAAQHGGRRPPPLATPSTAPIAGP